MNSGRVNIAVLFGLVLCLGPIASASAQALSSLEVPLKSSGTLPFYLDACQFESVDGLTRLEITYAIALVPPVGMDSLVLNIDLELAGRGGIVASLHERKHFRVRSDSLLTFIDLKHFALPADTVEVRMTVHNLVDDRLGRIDARIPVRDFTPILSLSDPLFISAIHRPEGNGEQSFLRSGLVMLPNPARVFSGQIPSAKAFFYFEINHLTFSSEGRNTYSLHYTVTDHAGRPVLVEERPDLIVVQANTSRVEKIALDTLPPGAYRLDLSVTDRKTGVSASSGRYFTLRGGESDEATALPMTPTDQEHYLEQLRFIAGREEIALFRQLDPNGKQQFLVRFWRAQDRTPETPENEFMVDYFARLAEAQRRFRGGLKSDMARIYLRYGAPLDIERQNFSARHNKPVEIWSYALNGSTQFVFVDRNNDGSWVLVHSNHPDEFSNTEWENDL